MSFWTYITGTVEVDVPGRTQPEIQYIIDSVLDHLPRVTGSEGDMEIRCAPRKGHNCSSSVDEYGMQTNNLRTYYGGKGRDGRLETQSAYVITISASLRDRMFDETEREFMKWLTRLAKRVWVTNVLVRLEGWTHEDYKRVIIDRPEGMYAAMESPSWSWKRHEYDPDEVWWCEHLMWERAPGYDVPLTFAEKYGFDDELTKESRRRRKWSEEVERNNTR